MKNLSGRSRFPHLDSADSRCACIGSFTTWLSLQTSYVFFSYFLNGNSSAIYKE